MSNNEPILDQSIHEAGIAASPEFALPNSDLREQLREQRIEEVYAQLERTAHSILKDFSFNAPEQLVGGLSRTGDSRDEIRNGMSFPITANLHNPKIKHMMKGIAHFAHEDTSDEIARDALKPPQDTTKRYSLTDNLDLEVEFGQDTGIYFGLVPQEEADKEVAHQDALALITSLEEFDETSTNFTQSIAEKVTAGDSEALSDEVLTFEDNEDELLLLIDSTTRRFRNWFDVDQLKSTGHKRLIEAMYKTLPYHYAVEEIPAGGSPEGLYFTEDGCIDKVVLQTNREGLNIVLQNDDHTDPRDLSELSLRPGFKLDLQQAYKRIGDDNGVLREAASAFIESPVAAQILSSFEGAGLVPNERIQSCFTELGKIERRWGDGYADLTREVGKLVNDSNRSLGQMFEGDEEDLKAAIQKLEDVANPAAQIVIDLLKGVVNRGVTTEGSTVLPVSSQKIEMRDGSCADAEVYAHNGKTVIKDADQTPLLLKSTYKRPLVVTLKPVILNGVTLPEGSLLASNDDGYLIMRVTSLGMSPEESLAAFGAQYEKNRSYSPSYDRHVEHIQELMAKANSGIQETNV